MADASISEKAIIRFPSWNTIGAEEREAVLRVLDRGVLSGFVGTWSEGFWGGPEVRALEEEWSRFFSVQESIAVNSATSGLYAAMGAVELEPGDEVIVTPFSMSASATAPLVYGAIPIFADVSPQTYTLDPDSIESRITKRTRAILVVNLFGAPAHWDRIREISQKYDLWVVEDNAQAPGAKFQGQWAGTLGDIGVFSLNYHKHIHCGEGGVCVTNRSDLADRLRLIRNHTEAVIESMYEERKESMPIHRVGWNYRMTELEAAVAREQLKKLPSILARKKKTAHLLRQKLQGIPGLFLPESPPESDPVYYTFPLRIDPDRLGISRRLFVKALQAMGIPLVERYVKPLYLSPLFQERIAFGTGHYPFSLQPGRRYPKGLCPVAERLYESELCYIPWCSYDIDEQGVEEIASAVHRIVAQKDSLRSAEKLHDISTQLS